MASLVGVRKTAVLLLIRRRLAPSALAVLTYPMGYLNVRRGSGVNSTRVLQASMIQEIKENGQRCEEAMRDGTFITYHRGSPLLSVSTSSGGDKGTIKYGVRHLTLSELLPHFDNNAELVIRNSVFLTLNSDLRALSAVLIPSKPEELAEKIESATDGKFIDLRVTIFGLPESEQILTSQGSALLSWIRNCAFCSRCGHRLDRNTAGSHKTCSGCKHVHYTSLSPVIIVLVTNRTQDKCLLVRQPNHPRGMFTAIAGYVEIGETLEDAVVREIAEEVGLDIQHQRYVLSQHWPLPMSSLMLGCLATADSDVPLTIDKRELQDAKWLSVSEVQSAVNSIEINPFLRFNQKKDDSTIFVPPKGALAYDLIKLWLRNISTPHN